MAIVRVMHTFMYDYDFEVDQLPPEWTNWNGEERWLWTFHNGTEIWNDTTAPKRYVWAESPAISEWQLTGDPEALTKSEDK